MDFRFEDMHNRQYRTLVVIEGKVVGAILIGHRDLAGAVSTAVADNLDVSTCFDLLEQGDWSVLSHGGLASVAPK